MGLPSLRDQLVHDFIQCIYKFELHPKDAAKKLGVDYNQYLALRDSRQDLSSAWEWGLNKSSGKLPNDKNTLEMKHRIVFQAWKRLAPRLNSMIENIPDGPKGDEMVMELIKNKFISETLPRESVGSQEITHKEEDPFETMSEEQILEIVNQKISELETADDALAKAKALRESFMTGNVIDAEYEIKDSGKVPRGDEPAGPEGRGQVLLDAVESASVGSDQHDSDQDSDLRSEPVQREDDS